MAHEDLKKIYELDAKETKRPWERWQLYLDCFGWKDLVFAPNWCPNSKYRRNPDIPMPKESTTVSSSVDAEKERHVHADMIIAWANGAKIQYQDNLHSEWHNVQEPSWNPRFNYRIAPATILTYRNFLWKSTLSNSEHKVLSVGFEDNAREPRDSWDGFIKWLGPWQEIELD